MASGNLGHDNLSRALVGPAQALALDTGDYPECDRDVLDNGEGEYRPALDLIGDRNTCSHAYRQALVPGIVARLPDHCRLMQTILDRLPR